MHSDMADNSQRLIACRSNASGFYQLQLKHWGTTMTLQSFELTIFNLNGTSSHYRFNAPDHQSAEDAAIQFCDRFLQGEHDGYKLHWYGAAI
jgi:hypothetical protein